MFEFLKKPKREQSKHYIIKYKVRLELFNKAVYVIDIIVRDFDELVSYLRRDVIELDSRQGYLMPQSILGFQIMEEESIEYNL